MGHRAVSGLFEFFDVLDLFRLKGFDQELDEFRFCQGFEQFQHDLRVTISLIFT